jgi:hypothetical protein
MPCESYYERQTSDKLVQLLGASRDGQDFPALDAILETSYERGVVELCCCFLELLYFGLLGICGGTP